MTRREDKGGISRGLSAVILAEALRLARRARSESELKARLLVWRKIVTGLGAKVDPHVKREALEVIDTALRSLGVHDPSRARLSWDKVPKRYRRLYERLVLDKDRKKAKKK